MSTQESDLQRDPPYDDEELAEILTCWTGEERRDPDA